MLWILARPLLDWIAEASSGDASPWSQDHSTCLKHLAPDFDCTFEGESDLSMEEFAEHVAILMVSHLEMDIPWQSLVPALAPLVQNGLPSCPASVHLVLLSHACWAPYLGDALHSTLVGKALALAARVPEQVPPTTLESRLKSEVWNLLAAQRPSQTWLSDDPLMLHEGPPLKKSRTREALESTLANKREQIRMLLANKISAKHMANTLADSQRVLARAHGSDAEALSVALSRQALNSHMLHLDSALDAWQLQIWQRRCEADPDGWALALATDESPPDQPRFGGLRFQVTIVYAPVWRADDTWDDSPDPPLDTDEVMADICHCPGKDGRTVMAVLDKQLRRLGQSRFDVVSVVGDGGGENEGASGIHATMEAEVPGFVRRRCLGHVAWRVADALLDAWDQHKDIKTLCAYMTDGVTWSRLQAIATTPLAEGGLGLFGEMSRGTQSHFRCSPWWNCHWSARVRLLVFALLTRQRACIAPGLRP